MINRKKRISFCLLLVFCAMTAFCHDEETERRSFSSLYAGAGLGINDISWNFELGYMYYLNSFMGVGVGLQFDNEVPRDGLIASMFVQEEHSKLIRLNLVPQLSFRTPGVKLKCDGTLFLQVMPGLMFSVPKNDRIYFTRLGDINGYDRGQPLSKFYTVKNRGGEWLYWRTKVAVCLGTKRANLSLGCVFSNYSIYDCRRNMVFDGKKFFDYGPRKITHSIYLEVSADI